MKDRIPAYNLQRPVTPAGQEITAFLFHHLMAEGEFEPKLVSRVLQPVASLKSYIVHHAEIMRLHSYMVRQGLPLPSADMEEIGQSLLSGLGDKSQETTEANIFPIESLRRGRSTERDLVICIGQQAMRERGKAITLIREMYNLKSFPGHIWSLDQGVASVKIAKSDRGERLKALNKTKEILETNRDQLPAALLLEKVSYEARD